MRLADSLSACNIKEPADKCWPLCDFRDTAPCEACRCRLTCMQLLAHLCYMFAQGRLLEKLIGVNGMVQLLEAIEDEHCCHAGDPAKAVIISPYAQPLRADDDLLVFAQVQCLKEPSMLRKFRKQDVSFAHSNLSSSFLLLLQLLAE